MVVSLIPGPGISPNGFHYKDVAVTSEANSLTHMCPLKLVGGVGKERRIPE